MKIKLLVSLAAADAAYAPGDFYECSAEEAQRHFDAGNAVPVEAVERAVKPSAKVEKRA
jgi:hypothetical protein